MFGVVLWGVLGLSTCPVDVCGPEPAKPDPDADWDPHPAQVRAVMRAFGRLEGRAPMFRSDEGRRLRPSMSNGELRTRLRDTNEVIHVHYGRCVSHSTTCPWVSISVDLHARRIEDAGVDLDQAQRTVELPNYRVFHMSPPTRLEQTWLVWMQPDRELPVAAEVWITGTLGLERAALGALPIRRLEAALAGVRSSDRPSAGGSRAGTSVAP